MSPRWPGLAAVLALGACATVPICRPAADAELSAELLFGLGLPDGGAVSTAAFEAFVAGQIAPRFAGFTILPGYGYWQGKPEGARLVLVAAPDTAATATALDAIRAAYMARFGQKSVGLITERSCADFNS